jgi:eukaryotic-like serine/threonine-protein kinase
MGTAHYMSPEQAQGHELGSKSDVYSLGITAYHLLSGQTPYTGTTPLSIAVQHVNNDVPYDRAKFGHVPDAAVYFLIAMTQREAARRPNAADAGRELRKILQQLTGREEVKLPSIDALTMPMGTTTFAPMRTAPTMPAMQRPAPPSPPPMQAPPMQSPPLRPQGVLQTPPGFAPTAPQFAPPQQFATPGTPTQPLPQQTHPHWQPAPEKGSNALLWIAIAVVVFVLLFFVGCGALMAAK